MGIPGLFLLAISQAVLNVASVVRTGCDPDTDVVASLPAGAEVEVRSSISGSGGSCYKVAASVEGKPVLGYVPAPASSGHDSFDQARRGARALNESAAAPVPINPKWVASNPVAARIQALIQGAEPGEALALAEQELRRAPKDPLLLALAGLASYRNDSLDLAIQYWNEALAIAPNPSIEQLLARARAEKAVDGGSERTVGARVVVRYERGAVSPQLAQALLAALDQEYSRISADLGCRAAEKVTAIVKSREAYMQGANAAEWSAAMYDGRIHVPVSPSARLDARTRQILAHELVHACLSELGQWPAWLQEGLAQRLSGEAVPPDALSLWKEVLPAGRGIRLNEMGQSFARMSARHAQAAYAIAYAAAGKLIELTASTGIRNVLRNPAEFERMTAEVERSLGF